MRTRSRGPSRAASSRLPRQSRKPAPLLGAPPWPQFAPPRGPGTRGPRTHLARELCVLFRLLCPRPPSPQLLPAVGGSGRGGVTEGSPRGGASHGSSSPAPWRVAGRGREAGRGEAGEKGEPLAGGVWAGGVARGRRRALALALLRPQPGRARSPLPLLPPLLLLPLARRRLLGAVCSSPRGSRSPGTPTPSIATLLTFGADVTRSPFTTLREPGSALPGRWGAVRPATSVSRSANGAPGLGRRQGGRALGLLAGGGAPHAAAAAALLLVRPRGFGELPCPGLLAAWSVRPGRRLAQGP